MPIKLKKTDIRNLEYPEIGYIILGFDEDGKLVKLDENGNYEPIIIETNDDVFNASILTLGTRVDPSINGNYSISQGENNIAAGVSSHSIGFNSYANAQYSYSRGQFLISSGDISTIIGKGYSNSICMEAAGNTSFVVQNCSTSNSIYGVFGDYSAILGGSLNRINDGAYNAVILGGTSNTITINADNSVILGGTNITATNSNSVYVSRLVLYNNNTQDISGVENGMMIYNSNINDIQLYINNQWYNFSDYKNYGVSLNTTQTITGTKIFLSGISILNLIENETSNVLYIDNDGYLSYGILPPTVTWESIDGDYRTSQVINSRIGFNSNDLLAFSSTVSLPVSTTWAVCVNVDSMGNKTLLANKCISPPSPTVNDIPTYNDVLSKTNTIPYNPTTNYHPATKKYVDDNNKVLVVGTVYVGDVNVDGLINVSYGVTLPNTNYNILLIPRVHPDYVAQWSLNDNTFVTVITKYTSSCTFAIREISGTLQHIYVDFVVIKN